MPVINFTVTLTGANQNLGVLGAAYNRGVLKQLILHADTANANVIYVGGNAGATLSNTEYGFRIEKPVSTIPAAPSVVEAVNTDLSDWLVLGTNGEKLHVCGIFS